MSQSPKSFLRTFLLATACASQLVWTVPRQAHAAALDVDAFVVPQGSELAGNQYVHADSADIDGTVNGDLVISAHDVRIRGVITGSVLVQATSVELDGVIKGSLRGIAGKVVLRGDVDGDVTVAVSELTTEPSSTVAGNLYYIASASELSGKTEGDRRDVLMSLPKAQTSQQQAYAGAESFLALALLGVILYALQRYAQSESLYREFGSHILRNLLFGMVTVLIGIPLSMLLMALSVGRWVGLGLGLGLGLVLLVSVIDAAYAVSRLTFWRKMPAQGQAIPVMMTGLLMASILWALPYVWVVPTVAWLIAVGARLAALRTLYRTS